MRTVLAAILLILAVVGVVGSYVEEREDTVFVKKKWVDVSREGSHYLLLTDKGIFEVDRPFWKTFDSSANPDAVFPPIQEGNSYRIKYVGWRIDFAYWYPLVFSATPS